MTVRETLCDQLNPNKRLSYRRAEIVKVHAVVGHEF